MHHSRRRSNPVQLFPLHAEVVEDALALGPLLVGDAGVGMAEHHAADATAHQGPAADETGFMRDLGRGHGSIAEAQGVLLSVAGVQAALAGLAGVWRAMGHPRQGAVEARRGNAAIGPQQHRAHLQATAGAEAAQLERHVHEDFIFELRAGHGYLGGEPHHRKNGSL